MSALLDLPETAAGSGDPLPPLWQWFYFLHWPPERALGPDGHLRDALSLPPLPDRQRMWAGGRCEITEPLRLGEPAERVSSLSAVTPKRGRTGELLFVTERREFRQYGRTCVVEEQDIWHLRLQPDPTLLFRFSALTANAHRIHCDTPYCRHTEGYPSPVVHGPLLALLMLELARRNAPERQVRSLSYRLRQPAFAGGHLLAEGQLTDEKAEFRVTTAREEQHATAEVTFA